MQACFLHASFYYQHGCPALDHYEQDRHPEAADSTWTCRGYLAGWVGNTYGRKYDKGRQAVHEMNEGGQNDGTGGERDDDHVQYYGNVNCLQAVGYCPPKSKNAQEGSRW